MKTFFLALFMTAFLKQPQSQIINVPPAEASHCRTTCTIYVDDGFGGYIGISASAGGWFVSCETALERACAKVAEIALDMLVNLE